jgi:hypothetical protein
MPVSGLEAQSYRSTTAAMNDLTSKQVGYEERKRLLDFASDVLKALNKEIKQNTK